VGVVVAAVLFLLGFQAMDNMDKEVALSLCRDCHPSEADSYAATGMARALERLRADEFAGLRAMSASSAGFLYAFEGHGSSARVVETLEKPAGVPARDSASLVFAIGAGELDRSYVAQHHGRLWLAPLEVVGHGAERRAALAPSHALAPGARLTQPVTHECLACHTDDLPERTWPLNLAPNDWQPSGISCAACHPAVIEHVHLRTAGSDEDLAADPFVRTASRRQRMERCAACHLQGDARIECEPGRTGPPPGGVDLLRTRAVFVAREATSEIGFVSHVQRLVLSRCYLESAGFADGGLACETCHDPHASVHEPHERGRVRAACQRCHETADGESRARACAVPREERPAERDCAACHLRRTGVFDVAEVAITDHWIQRRPPPPSAAKPLRFPESPSGDWRVFTWPEQGPAEDEPGLWMMALAHGGHDARARTLLDAPPGPRAERLAMYHHVRGSLLERAGDPARARAAYERALELDPELVEAAINLGPLHARLGDPARARALLDGLLARHPLADGAYRNRAVVRLNTGDESGFRADLEAALRLLPDAGLAQTLAKFAAQRGDAAAAERWRAEARRLDPR
jgi:predicted CXXCH cytochrome family protein